MGCIRALILLSACTGIVAAQGVPPSAGPPTLQLGTPIERTIGPGQSHTYQVIADENSLVQITVEQRGIDVIVRIFNANGKTLGEYDTPNGDEGPENVSFVTASKTPYRIEVTPLSREARAPGKYEIRMVELRQATEQEIKGSNNQEALKARGLALLGEIEGIIAEVRLPQTRIKAQLQAALLLWEADEKRALKYLTDAMTGFKELRSSIDVSSRQYSQNYHMITNLRFEIVQMLTARQPETALSFLRSTPALPDPYGNERDLASHEAAMEMEIANQIAAKDPKRTLEIARENLKKARYSYALVSTLNTLRQQNPEMAADLASEIANKLLNEKALKDSQAATVLINLFRMSGSADGNQSADTNGSPRRTPLLSEQQRRDLLQKALNEALGFKSSPTPMHSPEREYAWNLLQGLQQIGPELDTLVNGSAAAVTKRIGEFSLGNNSQPSMQEYYNALNNQNMPLDEVIQVLSKAPKDQKDQLFVNLSNRVMNNGDAAKAKQLINDYVTAPYQRQQALYNLENQEMYRAISKGKVDDALRTVASLSTAQERAAALTQIAAQIGPGYKRATAMVFLDQARALLSPSLQAQDQVQIQALFEIAKAYSRYDTKRSFEIVDPLVDQFNEISAAARTLDGFIGEFFEQDELNLQNGNSIAGVATQLSSTLGTLALTNFDRAKLAADRIRLPEVRLRAYLDIAQQAIQNQR